MENPALPLFTWAFIAVSMLLIVIIKASLALHRNSDRKNPIISLGSEREDIFAPGDGSELNNDDFYDDDE